MSEDRLGYLRNVFRANVHTSMQNRPCLAGQYQINAGPWATQNPIEQEGTYPLPEAQLDRFMFMTVVRYPTAAEELQIMKQSSSLQPATLNRVLDATTIEYLQDVVRRVPAADHVYEFARSLVRATRPGEAEAPKWLTDLVQW